MGNSRSFARARTNPVPGRSPRGLLFFLSSVSFLFFFSPLFGRRQPPAASRSSCLSGPSWRSCRALHRFHSVAAAVFRLRANQHAPRLRLAMRRDFATRTRPARFSAGPAQRRAQDQSQGISLAFGDIHASRWSMTLAGSGAELFPRGRWRWGRSDARFGSGRLDSGARNG